MITWALAMTAALVLWQACAPRTRRAPAGARPANTPTPRAARPDADWADVADGIANALRTGHSLRSALHQTIDEQAPAGVVVRHGATLDDVVAARTAGADELVVVRAIQTAWRLGGPAAAGMHAAAALLRERCALRAEARAHSAQARASAAVLTCVPLVFAVLGGITSASFRAVVTTPSGATALALGAGCNVLGWGWMRRIVQRATP